MELRFDYADDDSTTGFRLKEFELYNWGTYDKKVVKLALDKHNALLTGDIGSGKSTIVDAITTLLVPHQKITFNKAAGAESKERSISSYILGEYKSQQDETFKNSKAVSLRDESNFSVLLARFENDGYDESYTIAQFFYISNKQVNKFFISSKAKLGIKEDFIDASFKDVRSLKKLLKAKEFTKVYDTFKDYSKDFKRAMGIKNDQALNLFYQTVSLKAIGNLTSFVRDHMLEDTQIDAMIDELCKNFSELNHAHNLVLRAKEQIRLLEPIDKRATEHELLSEQKKTKEEMRDALPSYFASHKKKLLEKKLQEQEIEHTKTSSQKIKISQHLDGLESSQLDLKIEIEKNGGDRINHLTKEIAQIQKTQESKKSKNAHYNSLVKKVDLSVASNEHRFLKNSQDANESYERIEEKNANFQNQITRDSVTKSRYEDKFKEIEVEIKHLENNRSNIPKHISNIRDEMAKALNIEIENLPFAGELIEVKDKGWQGAIERVLHGFSLSLLISDGYYKRVSEYVNKTNLRGKLVYLKVFKKRKNLDYFEVEKNSLLHKIEKKADSPFYEPLSQMLQERYNIPCVESLDEFTKLKKALSKNGQYKSNYSKHEKDDRFYIDDKARWTLGWNNLEKLAALKEERSQLDEKLLFLDRAVEESKNSMKILIGSRDTLRDILKYESFDEIDWYSCAKEIENLNKELQELQKSSNILKSLQTRLSSIEHEIKETKSKNEELGKKLGGLERTIKDKHQELKLIEEELLFEIKDPTKEMLDTLFEQNVQEDLNLVTISKKETQLKGIVQKEIDKISRSLARTSEQLIQNMSRYKNDFSVESKDFDASLESISDFKTKLKELLSDDLPRFEKRFKALFKEKTIQKTTMIQAELEHQAKEIKSKIAKINNSLRDIEYNDSTYIKLIAETSLNKEIRDFKADLKSAISYAIADDNSYDEAKFLQIKKIIDRFNGRESFSEVDKKWRSLVTDVRNWFNFSASERYVSDDSEKEYYAHSGGKSGGQKEKLAYTVLASSLAFQFGLEHNEIRSRSFRFVMIDEAFGRGSDESTKYALKLFEKLNLQLLVITPKQKINVIEPFVKSVHFVHNEDGRDSSLLSMSIESYQKNTMSV